MSNRSKPRIVPMSAKNLGSQHIGKTITWEALTREGIETYTGILTSVTHRLPDYRGVSVELTLGNEEYGLTGGDFITVLD